MKGPNRPPQPIDLYTLDGKYIRTFPSVGETARFTGATKSNVCAACNGDIRSAKGYRYAKQGKPLYPFWAKTRQTILSNQGRTSKELNDQIEGNIDGLNSWLASRYWGYFGTEGICKCWRDRVKG